MNTRYFPIQNSIDVSEYLRPYNSCMRYAYNRFLDGMNELQIRHDIKSRGFFPELDSWFIQCAIRQGNAWYNYDPNGKIVFGGLKNLRLRASGDISQEEWRRRRTHMMNIQGQAPNHGNRKFELDIIENNQIVFKPKRGAEIIIKLPKLHKGERNLLCQLQMMAEQKKCPFMVTLDNEKICITFDEAYLNDEKYQPITTRVFGIDLNPNYVGYSVLKFDKNDEFVVLDSGVIELKPLNQQLHVKSDDPKQLKQNRKRKFELFEVAKFLVEKAKHFHCSRFSVEELDIPSGDHKKGKHFNWLVNNVWSRTKFVDNLRKRCRITGIDFLEVWPDYTSIIGNVLHGEQFPDQIASSIEIARRGFRKFQKGWNWPKLPTALDLRKRWKETFEGKVINNWKQLTGILKNSGVSYRGSLNKYELKVFRLKNIKSCVLLWSSA